GPGDEDARVAGVDREGRLVLLVLREGLERAAGAHPGVGVECGDRERRDQERREREREWKTDGRAEVTHVATLLRGAGVQAGCPVDRPGQPAVPREEPRARWLPRHRPRPLSRRRNRDRPGCRAGSTCSCPGYRRETR